VILQKVLELDQASITDWTAHRDALEARLMGWLEAALPGSAAQVVVKLSASARTAERFTLNSGGAMLGWEMAPDQLGDVRGGLASPVPGLYFVGHWAQPGGGITPVMVSSQRVAEAIGRANPRDAAQQ
jgi:phytoene dehydrogenase-like protein